MECWLLLQAQTRHRRLLAICSISFFGIQSMRCGLGKKLATHFQKERAYTTSRATLTWHISMHVCEYLLPCYLGKMEYLTPNCLFRNEAMRLLPAITGVLQRRVIAPGGMMIGKESVSIFTFRNIISKPLPGQSCPGKHGRRGAHVLVTSRSEGIFAHPRHVLARPLA